MLPEKFYQAVEVAIYIAVNAGDSPVSSKAISEYKNVNQRHLEPLLQQMVKFGIIKGSKGPKGGYRLAKEQRKISMYDIMQCSTSLKKSEISDDTAISNIIVAPLREELNTKIKQKSQKILLNDLTAKYLENKSKDSNCDNFDI